MPGRDNVVADVLSRPAAVVLPAEGGHLDLVEMAHAQQLCGETQQLRNRLNVQTVLTSGVELYCDCSDSMLSLWFPWCGGEQFLTACTILHKQAYVPRTA